MKIRELLNTIETVAKKNHIVAPMMCGGVVREKVMGTLAKLDDIDITNGESTIKNLAKEVELELGKNFTVHSKMLSDGHTSLFMGRAPKTFKLDFSSNFIVPNIDQELAKKGIKNPTPLIREAFSRDFTCNSLLSDLRLKKIIDPTKLGISDIKSKILRTCLPPEITLHYNTNRIIRVVYLAVKLGFSIDPGIVSFIRANKNLLSEINPSYLTNTLNKAIHYSPEKTAEILTQLDLWQSIPEIPDALLPFRKSAQLRKNEDYGDSFYGNLQNEKSVGNFRKKRKKKRKKDIKNIRKMKLAYDSGIDEYMDDNFPIVLNDDLEVRMDRQENKSKRTLDQDDEDEGEDGGDTGETLLNPSDYSSSMFGTMHGGDGGEGLLTMPISEYPGNLSQDTAAVTNNDYGHPFQSNGLFQSEAANKPVSYRRSMPLYKSAQAHPESEVIIFDDQPHPEDVIEMGHPANDNAGFHFSFPHIPEAGGFEVSEPANDNGPKQKDGPKDRWDWQSGGMGNLLAWIQDRLNTIPEMHGGETTAIERAMSYLKRLNSEISKAISNDYDGEIDVKTMEVARKWIYEAIDKLEKAHDKLHENHYSKKKRDKAAEVEGGMVKEARTPYTGGIIVTVPLLISRCARVCINGAVSAGHDITELYRLQVKKYGLNMRECAELAQHISDMGFIVREDRLMLPDEDIVVQEGIGDLASNYYA